MLPFEVTGSFGIDFWEKRIRRKVITFQMQGIFMDVNNIRKISPSPPNSENNHIFLDTEVLGKTKLKVQA